MSGSPARARLYPKSPYWASRNCACRQPIAAPKQTVRSGAERHEGQVRPCRHDVRVVRTRIRLSGVVSLSGFGGQADAGSGQEPGECGGEFELPVGRTSGSSA